MRQPWVKKLISIFLSVIAGIATHFLLNNLILSLLTIFVFLLVFLIIFSKEFPVKLCLDRTSKHLLGFVSSYRYQDEASSSILKQVASSRRIDILLIRGHRFILDDDSYLGEILKTASPNTNIRLLLLNPECPAMKEMLEKMELKDSQRHAYLAKCELVKKELDTLVTKKLVNYLYYDSIPIWKLLITDHGLFVGGYDPRIRGSLMPLGEYEDGGKPTYIGFVNYFDSLWTSYFSAES
jgi:hypothetical protein